MVNKPVKREIFAADFSDRGVHHLIYRAIYGDIEKCFIEVLHLQVEFARDNSLEIVDLFLPIDFSEKF
jgi:hypothetical protein